MKWIKIEDKLPPKNTLVLVRRLPNKVEENPIYYAMRQDKELSTNPDASRDCFWFGRNQKQFLSENESCYNLDSFGNFSDITVKEWAFIEFIP